jgi:predicted  nucleic acid-binding Zn-ribbon protein
MDSPAETTSANDFRTPPRILIPKLARSRDQWKAKAKEKIHSRDLQHSRARWKERALDAERKLQELQQQLQHADTDLAQARSQLAQLPDSKKT